MTEKRTRNTGATLGEVALALGCSRENVRLIERKAINKLRSAMGSSYRGPIAPFLRDVVGVPEPAGDDEGKREKQRAAVKKQRRMSGGRFAR